MEKIPKKDQKKLNPMGNKNGFRDSKKNLKSFTLRGKNF
ncbi:MAG: hypothetical protein CM15mV100_010 [uncultured marine virus]|nr:MAG: hypothetical protein CM15mV100_010 [uncultured marine virus]